MIGVIALGLSILVMLGGLYLLAKSKKDSLGNLYIFSSYSAIVLGTLLFVGTIVGGVYMMKCHHNKGNSGYVKGHGSSCGQSAGCAKFSSCCSSHHKGCSAHSKCGSGSAYSHHGNKSSCSHFGAQSSYSHHGEKSYHKKHHGENKGDIEIEVEVEEVDE